VESHSDALVFDFNKTYNSGRSSSDGSVKNVLFSAQFGLALGPTQPLIQWVTEALSPVVKRPGSEVDFIFTYLSRCIMYRRLQISFSYK
jgi:hypothetical protein